MLKHIVCQINTYSWQGNFYVVTENKKIEVLLYSCICLIGKTMCDQGKVSVLVLFCFVLFACLFLPLYEITGMSKTQSNQDNYSCFIM